MNHSRHDRFRRCSNVIATELESRYTAALLACDQRAAEESIRQALDAKLSAAQIDDQIIAPALWRVGQLWARGEISVADEHAATEISTRVLTLQREAQRVASARPEHRVMLATPSGDLHVVALRMVGNLLHEGGYDVMMIGGDVPIHALAHAAQRHDPDAICVSATMPVSADRLVQSIRDVRSLTPGVGFVVGGRGLNPAVAGRLRSEPRVHLCTRVSEVVEEVDALVKKADLN